MNEESQDSTTDKFKELWQKSKENAAENGHFTVQDSRIVEAPTNDDFKKALNESQLGKEAHDELERRHELVKKILEAEKQKEQNPVQEVEKSHKTVVKYDPFSKIKKRIKNKVFDSLISIAIFVIIAAVVVFYLFYK